MDAFYGPVRLRADTTDDISERARKHPVIKPVINPKGILAILTDPRNFTPEARLQRKKDRPEVWEYKNYIDQTGIFDITDKRTDFTAFAKDHRGLEGAGWVTNDIIDKEIARLQPRLDVLDVFIADTWQTILLSDSRVEWADSFNLSDEMLARRFWVFPQGNVQFAVPRHDFEVQVNTQEGESADSSSFKATCKSISGDFKGFLTRIRDMLPKREKNKSIWWTSDGPETATDRRRKYVLPEKGFSGVDFVPWLHAMSGRSMWVGTTGTEHLNPMRAPVKVIEAPNSHWWVMVIDSNTGGAFLHDSMAGLGSKHKALRLVRNLNWLLGNLSPELKKQIPGVRTSGAAPFEPVGAPKNVPGTTQQKNGSDCGIFAIGNITGFVERLEREDIKGICTANLLPKGWRAGSLREKLCADIGPVS